MIKYKLINDHTYNDNSTILYIKDGTGVYSTDNTGGYGTPNDNRDSVALLIAPLYMSSVFPVLATVSPYNPLTVENFNITVAVDGWYKISLLALPLYDLTELSNYLVGSIYFDTSIDKPVVIVSTALGNIAREVQLINILNMGYEVTTVDELVITNSSKTKIRVNSMISDLITNNVGFTDKSLIRLKDNYNAVRAVLQGAIYEFCRGNKAVAQKSIEFLNTNDYVSV